MVRIQVGNDTGIAAVGKSGGSGGSTFPNLLADITADGVNTVTVSVAQARNIRPGMKIDLVNKATGAVLASGRTVSSVDLVTGILTYSGADVTAVAGTHGIYLANKWQTPMVATSTASQLNRDAYTNINGGGSESHGFDMITLGGVQSMRDRLQAYSATTYSDAELDKMTYNDLVYALRQVDAPGSIK